MAKVVWRPQAVDDIRSIASYIAQYNPSAARGMAARLFLALILSVRPGACNPD